MTRSIPVHAVPAEPTDLTAPFDGEDTAHDECGVLGLSTPHGDGVAQLAFFGLFALQHRGQEAAGIAVSDGKRSRLHKEAGLVANVFTPEALKPLTGYHAIGHTRYSTTGSNAERNIQPFLVETMHGPLSVAHNGNLVNAASLREELLNKGFGLTATSDTEVFTLMLAAAGGRTWQERIERTLPAWKGAFSLVILASDQVIAVRDPWGFRPLSVGRLPHGGHAVASETCALSTLGCVDIDEVKPGEMVTLRGAEIERQQVLAPQSNSARCTFEFVYFSRPDSVWDDKSVHHVRQHLGPRTGQGVVRRRRRRHPGARLVDPCCHRVRQRDRSAVQRRTDQEPLHRSHVHRADAGHTASVASHSSSTRCRRTSRASGSS